MEIELKRTYKGNDYTIGELYISGIFICNTLEDKVRTLNSCEDKVYANTAIPYGRYKVILSYSAHFKQLLPEILNVEYFKYIRIHAGNNKEDTKGCVLVGECKDVKEGYIYNSKKSLKKVMDILIPAWNNKEDIYITIK
jgi:hypothetical protein